jgi:hypothetical protein
MTTVTFGALMNALAVAEGKNPSAAAGTSDITDEVVKYNMVSALNSALKWVWKLDDPMFIWPVTVTVDTSVAISGGIIAHTEVGSSDWVSFWESDPRPYINSGNPTVNPVPVSWDGTQFYTQSSSASSPCFAFYRSACPQGTWVAASAYATPTVPAEFEEVVVNKAAEERLNSLGLFEQAQFRRKEAVEWMEARKAAILNSTNISPWGDNIVVV